MNDSVWREECILNTNGIIGIGIDCNNIEQKQWNFAQFSNEALLTLCKVLDYISREKRSNPISISRHFSWISNSDSCINGILKAKWGANYTGGTDPMDWVSSEDIFHQYLTESPPVKYGQCWVFAGIVASLSRSAGIPARPVTCFNSAHERSGDNVITLYYTPLGNIDYSRQIDQLWNFHVWTEMWMARPDVVSGDGWQIVDGTPQELSDGKFQCGPAPRSFVKNGVNCNFDTDFVRSEVSSLVEVYKYENGVECVSTNGEHEAGILIMTQYPRTIYGVDLTDEYKNKETSVNP